VWLPLSDQASANPPGASEASALDKLRVLLVDDAEDVLEPFAELLRFEGADVMALSRGADALAAAESGEFDLLFSDIAMPGMDGYALIAALRARDKTASLPAIALTGFGRAQDVKRALAAGFDAHLTKPVEMDELLDVVARLPRLETTRSARR
jgi:two-component system CheB/CheR fusion protein